MNCLENAGVDDSLVYRDHVLLSGFRQNFAGRSGGDHSDHFHHRHLICSMQVLLITAAQNMTTLKADKARICTRLKNIDFRPDHSYYVCDIPLRSLSRTKCVLTTGHVTYTQQFNGNMRDKERRKVIVRN